VERGCTSRNEVTRTEDQNRAEENGAVLKCKTEDQASQKFVFLR
jgi:hypothetical protein